MSTGRGRSSVAERRNASSEVAGSTPAARSNLRAVGLHIFAGGMSIGVGKHFQLMGHLERTKYAVRSWEKYRPDVPVWVDKTARWEEPVAKFRGQVDTLYCNPPCSIWSGASAGLKVKEESSALRDWTRDCFRVGRELGAKVVVVESVRNALNHGSQFYRDLWREHHDQWGGMMWVKVNAIDCGVPQYRPRLFVVLAPEVFKFERPSAPRRTLLETIAGAPPDEPVKATSLYRPKGLHDAVFECAKLLEPGQKLNDLSDEVVRRVSPGLADKLPKMYPAHLPHRLRADEPCPVIYSMPKYVHPLEPRFLTWRECARLTGYPDDFEMLENEQMTKFRMLGKTVVPQVAEWVAREVAAYLRDERACRGEGEAVVNCATDSRAAAKYQMTLEDAL